ncbi:MAG: hypothetical protein ACK4RF_08085 [Cyclobacteriaceae bacterium]
MSKKIKNLGDYVSVSTSYTFYYSRISGPETFMTHTLDLTPLFQFEKDQGIYHGANRYKAPGNRHKNQQKRLFYYITPAYGYYAIA